MPFNGLVAPRFSGTGSLSPIFSKVINGILEEHSVYCGSLRNSSLLRTIPKTKPASAAAAQFFRTPLQKCIANGLAAVSAPQEIERARLQRGKC